MRFVRRSTKGGLPVDRRNFELLESRMLFSAVAWTGAGDGVSWGDPSNWSSRAVPTISDDVTIADNSAAPIKLGSGVAAVNSLSSNRSISIDGGRLRVATTADVTGSLDISNGGLVGGAWRVSQPVTLENGDRLNGVTFNSDVTVAPSAVVTVIGGLTLNGTMTLQVSGNVLAGGTSEAADLRFSGTQSLQGTGNIVLDDNLLIQVTANIRWLGETIYEETPDQQPVADPAWSSSINVVDTGGTAAILTIGSSITIEGGGLIGPKSSTNAAVVNQGMIDPDSFNGFTFFIPLTNAGSIEVPNVSSSFNFLPLPFIPYDATNLLDNPDPPQFDSSAPVMLTNTGIISDDGYLEMDQAGWSNNGSITVDDGALILGSGINSGSIDATGGTVAVTLDSSLQTDFSPGSINMTGAMLGLTVNGQTSDDSINRVNLISNDSVYLTGTIDNTGESIIFAGYEDQLEPLDGEIDGGTLRITNGSILTFTDESATFRNLVMEISDSGEMLIGSPMVPGVVPTFADYGLNSATLNIAYATDSTLGQLFYDSPTGQVSIANQVQELNSYQSTPPSSSMQASVIERIAVIIAPQPSPMGPAAPVVPAAPTAKAASVIHASQPISGTNAAVFSQSLSSVVSQIESGGSAVDNLLFAEEPIFA
jgi:hypothetical protein